MKRAPSMINSSQRPFTGVRALRLRNDLTWRLTQREEQIALAPGDPRQYSLAGGSVLFQEGDSVGLDVGILADLVRIRVMPAVLVHPPSVADAHERPG